MVNTRPILIAACVCLLPNIWPCAAQSPAGGREKPKQEENQKALAKDAQLEIGPTLVKARTEKLDLRIWAYTYLTKDAHMTFCCIAEEKETEPPSLEVAHRRAQEQRVDSVTAVANPKTDKSRDVFQRRLVDAKADLRSKLAICYYPGGYPLLVTLNGQTNPIIACTPTTCLIGNEVSMFHLACPLEAVEWVNATGKDGAYPVGPRCKDAMESAFETRVFGKPNITSRLKFGSETPGSILGKK